MLCTVNQATVTSTLFANSTIGDWPVLVKGTTLLTVGLHEIVCELFVGNPTPSQQAFKVEFLLNNNAYPTLSSRQLIQPDSIVRVEGKWCGGLV